MSSAPPAVKKSNFVIFFLIIVGICGAAGFLTLRYVALQGVAARRAQSRERLLAMGKLLADRANTNEGRYPDKIDEVLGAHQTELATNPSWPDEAGYVYVTGVRNSDPPESLLVYENVPPEKRKIGRLVLRRDATVELLTEDQFQKRLSDQESRASAQQRPWRTETVGKAERTTE